MNKKKIALGTGMLVGALFAGTTYNLGKKIYDATFGATPREFSEVGAGRLADFQHQKFMVENSKNGYLIETLHLKSNIESPNVMVIVHGLKSNYRELLSLAFRYLDEGTNVIMYNQRRTGETGGNNYTFGYFERFDMEEIATIARRLYPGGWVGIHGFSMGAATAAFHSELNEKTKSADFYILDGPFHTLESTLDASFEKRNYHQFWYPYLRWAGSVIALLKSRIKYRDVKPILALSKTSVPVLIMHGTKDYTCPFEGAKLMYEAIPHKNKELKAFTDLGHCEAHHLQTQSYFATIWNFIGNKCIKSA